jgi:hypothetical protein
MKRILKIIDVRPNIKIESQGRSQIMKRILKIIDVRPNIKIESQGLTNN